MESRILNKGARLAARAATAALLLALAACGDEDGGEAKAFHVVLISMDGVRATDATPNLTQFGRTSTGFPDLPSSEASTLAKVATMLTGLLPTEHGAGVGEQGTSILGPEQTPLPEYLIDHGYNTSAIIASDLGLNPESGLDQGTRDYQTLPGSAGDVSVLAEDWINRHWRQPFFLYLHLPPAGEDEAAQTDEALGLVLRTLAARGLLDQSMVIVTGDHGTSRTLQIKAPSQKTSDSDPRSVRPEHLPQLLLRHMALPVAAVRPNSYFTHPLEPLPVAKDGNP
ncbi:MAG: sulfatase-like hydrolase/transferase [Planctomycetota bacterium]|nr:sulfatase-like hydrolase/transferase [Planctomycetota bacterium]